MYYIVLHLQVKDQHHGRSSTGDTEPQGQRTGTTHGAMSSWQRGGHASRGLEWTGGWRASDSLIQIVTCSDWWWHWQAQFPECNAGGSCELFIRDMCTALSAAGRSGLVFRSMHDHFLLYFLECGHAHFYPRCCVYCTYMQLYRSECGPCIDRKLQKLQFSWIEKGWKWNYLKIQAFHLIKIKLI